MNYLLGNKIVRGGNSKRWLRVGIVFNMTQLILLRYAAFAIDPLLGLISLQLKVSGLAEVIVPIGISYYTLQGIGYLINLKMGWEKPEKSFAHFLLYIIFFPKFISGPIERSNNFLPQLTNILSFNRKNISEGFRLIINGLLRKVVIANQLSLIINPIYSNVSQANGLVLLLVIFLQPLYLYFDFSGYTNIAIGVARGFGIKLLPNFNMPLFSENVTIFWRRFHMSLAFWFNDYVFKQLSFRLRRWKKYASVTAVFITWILFGIWHGAGWNFMVLGMIQALAINYEFFTKKLRAKLFCNFSPVMRKWIGRFITYFFFGSSLVFFFSPDLQTAIQYFVSFKTINLSIYNGLITTLIISKTKFFVAIGIMTIFMIDELAVCDWEERYRRIKILLNSNKTVTILMRYLFYYLAILLLFYYGGNDTQFVYFQF